MNISIKICVSFLVSMCGLGVISCSNPGERDEADQLSCRQYLSEVGYNVLENEEEITRVMDNISVPKNERAYFCLGSLAKPSGGFCYLAMPADGRLDGEYTDCPYELLR
jgi:hypothetical protein